MKLPLSWLKEFIEIKKTPAQLAELLTLSGTEVTAAEKAGEGIDDQVIVAEVKAINKHPNADKLQLVTVKTGDRTQEVVCGAFNFKVGDKVPLALAGAKLANGLQLEKAVIRGVESNGMLCAEDELGLGEDHSGILILDKKAKIGAKVSQVLAGGETVLDLDITPNRPDCLSIIGLAREAAAVTNQELRIKNLELKEVQENIKDCLTVKVEDKKLCPLYTARVIKGVAIKESPAWLKQRLIACGVRPINNIVDVTNYIMLETGQPLHAFDASGIEQIVVRSAKKGEKLKTLDKKLRELDPKMLLITDGQEPLAVAGVMGGLASEIKEKTQDIILESAHFDPYSIRKTSQKLNLRSESSFRFEKGVDYQKTEENLDRAAALITAISGGWALKGTAKAGQAKKAKKVIDFDPKQATRLLGVEVKPKQAKEILQSLGFVVTGSAKFKVEVPSWRQQDVDLGADLIEEVGRLLDYNKMPPTFLKGELEPPRENSLLVFQEKVRDILVIAGMIEVYSYSFYGQPLNDNQHLEIANPLSKEQKYLRTSFQEVLPMMAHNLNFYDQLKLFEIGNLYLIKDKGKHQEKNCIFGLLADKEETNSSYFLAKGMLRFLARRLNIKNADYDPALLELRMVNAKERGSFKVPANTAMFLLDTEKLRRLVEPKIYQPFSPYPEVQRDIAFWVNKEHTYKEIEKAIANLDPLLQKIDCFDVFPDKQNKKHHSLALRLTWQSDKRTLKSEEVEKTLEKIIATLQNKFKIKLRSKN